MQLATKLRLAFLLMGFLGILLVAGFANRFVARSLTAFDLRFYRSVMADQLGRLYEEYDGWPDNLRRGRFEGGRMFDWLVVDSRGNLLWASSHHFVNLELNAMLQTERESIVAHGEVVGYLIARPLSQLDVQARQLSGVLQQFSLGLNRILFLAIGISFLLSLFLASWLSRTFTRPIRELQQATLALGQGQTPTVPVRGRDEIAQLAASFNQMSAQLRQAEITRKQMTADIAHDLRTPVSIILGHAEAVRDGVFPSDGETMEIIHDEARRLSRMIEDLRTLSLADAGQLYLHLQPIAPYELLRRAYQAHLPQAQQQGVNLSLECSEQLPFISADIDRMAQLLDNLMGNSLRHTPEGGTIRLIGRLLNPQTVQLQIKDSGCGIDADLLPHIFDRFYRIDRSRQRQIGAGSGLGLAIAKSIVEKHGGTILAESVVQQGTTMTIQLPLPIAQLGG